MSTRKPVLPTIPLASCEAWLEGYRATSDGLWLKLSKKASGIWCVALAEAIDGAGWVESQAAGFDDLHRLLRFTPRRPGSRRTKGNRGKVRKLIGQGRMKPASLREVERASTDGRWEP